ncbi:hypothetical protein M2175_003908 [Bradyrhizobium elkanii]|uniref:hypothetical protein n=1 Tax=Bradyrhizobium TaxID=374 RepID=UPI002167BBE9|nr:MULTISPECIES: hypothetical protein [Bradyrhizobium]MCS3928877.1 hypothetical protein [Bradyrhizobium elkanii]MCS3969431.1 hypothetical protein [Bradyrhizobium japonicum]
MNVASVSRDLTEQKASEAALRHLSDNLERRVIPIGGTPTNDSLRRGSRFALSEIAE